MTVSMLISLREQGKSLIKFIDKKKTSRAEKVVKPCQSNVVKPASQKKQQFVNLVAHFPLIELIYSWSIKGKIQSNRKQAETR